MNTPDRGISTGEQSEGTTNISEQPEASYHPELPTPTKSASTDARIDSEPQRAPVTRKDLDKKPGLDKRKMLLLGGGLLAAVLFFVFTAVLGRSPENNKRTQASNPAQQKSGQSRGSVTPLTETVRKPADEDSNGQLSPGDIKRTRTNNGVESSTAESSTRPKAMKPAAPENSLASIPSFPDTQQKWEEPKSYGPSGEAPQTQSQQQSALKEPSLIFVRSQTQTAGEAARRDTHMETEQPVLQVTPGTRIQAKLETQISSAVSSPVVAVVEYTYATGDQVVIPAGARVYGQLRQADQSGYVDVKFEELELLDGAREKIDAIGAALDLGPIKGAVFGKNTGKNFLIRTVSGLGSVAAMIVGNNNSSAFSEDDMLRQRVAENVGTAGDSELMTLNATSRIVVSVPADTKIYVVFTKHERSPSTLHKVAEPAP